MPRACAVLRRVEATKNRRDRSVAAVSAQLLPAESQRRNDAGPIAPDVGAASEVHLGRSAAASTARVTQPRRTNLEPPAR